MASCQQNSSILATAPMAFPGGPKRSAATAACASLPPRQHCRVSRAGAGSDRKGATHPPPGSLSRRRGQGFADYAPSAAGSSLTPLAATVPGPGRQSHQGGQGLAVPAAEFEQKGNQCGRSERPHAGDRSGTAPPDGPDERCPAMLPGTPFPAEQSQPPAKRYGAWWIRRRRQRHPCPADSLSVFAVRQADSACAAGPATPRVPAQFPACPALETPDRNGTIPEHPVGRSWLRSRMPWRKLSPGWDGPPVRLPRPSASG